MSEEVTVYMEDVIKEYPEILVYQREIREARAASLLSVQSDRINLIRECVFKYCEAHHISGKVIRIEG